MRYLPSSILSAFLLVSHLLLPAHAQQNGPIAYTNGDEIRLVEPDGTDDRLVWMVPDTIFSITKLAWRPDGGEIAFASDHEMAISIHERDIYGIRPDGTGLRKLTNPPRHEALESFDKGTITVTVTNYASDGGPYFVYVMGAPEPQQVIINPGGSRTLVFTDVADFGEGAFQHAVVISGIFRWRDAAVAADVVPGATVNAGTIIMTSPVEREGADGPFWRSDGTRLGYLKTFGLLFNNTCIVEQVPVPPPLGFYYDPIFEPDLFDIPCAVDWAPVPAIADELLVTDYTDYTSDGLVHVYRVTEGSQNKSEPIVTFDGYVQIYDIRWLLDASGFVTAQHDALLERGLNLYEYRFDDGSLTRVTDFTGEEEGVRSFSISPDGQFIVFEYVENADDRAGDIFLMRRDGTERRLLAENGASPHFGVQASSTDAGQAVELPTATDFLTVYPQPVQGQASISFHLSQPQELIMRVYDVLGRQVSSTSLGMGRPGEQRAALNATAFAPGAYFIEIVGSAGKRKMGRAMVVK